jgi:putative copper export protein/mono/diheme cytochrome c family protein
MFNGAWPAGAIDAAHVPLVLARAVWLCTLFSATGALTFRALEGGTDAVAWPGVREPLTRLIVASLALACSAWAVWSVLQAAAIAGATDIAATISALEPVFVRSAFGHRAAAQLGLLALAWASLWLGWGWARAVPAVLALGAVTIQVGHLHAWAMTGSANLLTGAVLLHLWAAALWLGALLPLRLVVRGAPLGAATACVRRFSHRATLVVALLAATALYQGIEMSGGLAGLFGATYGWVMLAKAVLFAVLLALACRNRFLLAPGLAGDMPGGARVALMRCIAQETGIGIAVLLVAAVLTALPPGMHVEPAWPFTVRPSMPFTGMDTAVVAGLAVAVVLLAAAVLLRRARWPALAVAAVLALLAVPRVGAVTQPATPTSFYRSQTGFTAASVAAGATTFGTRCASCHAAGGPKLAASDGDIFWTLTTHPDGALDDDARWNLIDFLRARAAVGSGAARAPDVQLACADGSTPMLSDLRGTPVRLSFRPVAGTCAITDSDGPAAYAVATGLTPAQLAPAELSIDADGRLGNVFHAAGAQVGLR